MNLANDLIGGRVSSHLTHVSELSRGGRRWFIAFRKINQGKSETDRYTHTHTQEEEEEDEPQKRTETL